MIVIILMAALVCIGVFSCIRLQIVCCLSLQFFCFDFGVLFFGRRSVYFWTYFLIVIDRHWHCCYYRLPIYGACPGCSRCDRVTFSLFISAGYCFNGVDMLFCGFVYFLFVSLLDWFSVRLGAG